MSDRQSFPQVALDGGVRRDLRTRTHLPGEQIRQGWGLIHGSRDPDALDQGVYIDTLGEQVQPDTRLVRRIGRAQQHPAATVRLEQADDRIDQMLLDGPDAGEPRCRICSDRIEV